MTSYELCDAAAEFGISMDPSAAERILAKIMAIANGLPQWWMAARWNMFPILSRHLKIMDPRKYDRA